MAKNKASQGIRENLEKALTPGLDAMLIPLQKALDEQENEIHKPYKLTVTLSSSNGVQTRVCMKVCTTKDGRTGWNRCEDCVD